MCVCVCVHSMYVYIHACMHVYVYYMNLIMPLLHVNSTLLSNEKVVEHSFYSYSPKHNIRM